MPGGDTSAAALSGLSRVHASRILPRQDAPAGVLSYRDSGRYEFPAGVALSTVDPTRFCRASHLEAGMRRSTVWLKFKNPNAPAVKREAEEDWGRGPTFSAVPQH